MQKPFAGMVLERRAAGSSLEGAAGCAARLGALFEKRPAERDVHALVAVHRGDGDPHAQAAGGEETPCRKLAKPAHRDEAQRAKPLDGEAGAAEDVEQEACRGALITFAVLLVPPRWYSM